MLTMYFFAQVINRFLAAMEAIDTPAHVLDSLLQPCLAFELLLRRLFATDRENPMIASPYVGLIDVFDLPFEARLARPRDWDDQESDFVWQHHGVVHRFPQKHLLQIEPDLRRSHGDPCMVDDLATFCKILNGFSGGALACIQNWDKIMVGGGSVLAALTAFLSVSSQQELFEFSQSPAYKSSDIDLFLWGMTEAQASRRMEEIFDCINSSAMCGAICFRSKNTITIQTEFPRRPIQIIMRLYRSPAELLCGFDVDCCCVCFNGTNVFTTPCGLAAIVRQCNTIDLTRRSPSYEHRLMKYSTRGYEVFYPLLERRRINYHTLADPERAVYPKGLGRLIVYEIMSSNYTYFPALYDDLGGPPYPTPVPLESLRPSNYDYGWCKIPYGPQWWHPKIVRRHVRTVADLIVTAVSEKFQDYDGPPTHFHVVTSGTMRACLTHCCRRDDVETSTPFPEDFPPSLFRGPACFIRDDPGRQLVGSFHPSNFDDWVNEAYFDLGGDGRDDD